MDRVFPSHTVARSGLVGEFECDTYLLPADYDFKTSAYSNFDGNDHEAVAAFRAIAKAVVGDDAER
jgi:hypothetical protein